MSPGCIFQYSSSEDCSDTGDSSDRGYETGQSSLVESAMFHPSVIPLSNVHIVSSTYTNRAGESQVSAHLPDNHKFVRPDDTIHMTLESSQDIIVILSDSQHHPHQIHSQWLGQFNGREEFKVSHLRNSNHQNLYRLSFTTGTFLLDFRVEMKIPLCCVRGHLAIRLNRGQQARFALSLPPNSPFTPGFQVAASLISDGTIYHTPIPSFLTLADCVSPLKFTTQYPKKGTSTKTRNT